MTLDGFMGPLVFLGSLGLMFLVVPWQRIKELLLPGAVIGLGIAIILIYLMQNTLGIWIFHNVDPISVGGISLFLSLAWIPAVITYSHLLAQYKNIVLIGLVVAAFPFGATIIHWFMLDLNLLTYNNWNLPLTFLVSLAIHLGILAYLYYTERLENFRGIDV